LGPRMTSSSRDETGSTLGSSGISYTLSIVKVLSVEVWCLKHFPTHPQQCPVATAVQVSVNRLCQVELLNWDRSTPYNSRALSSRLNSTWSLRWRAQEYHFELDSWLAQESNHQRTCWETWTKQKQASLRPLWSPIPGVWRDMGTAVSAAAPFATPRVGELPLF
jgi:hypothetical protein